MAKYETIQYYVEGENEKCLIEALKKDARCIKSGKVDIFNTVTNRFSKARILPLKPGTLVVLVYDTDVDSNLETFKYNIDFLNKQAGIKAVICIPQVRNLEDELMYSCDIKNILEITNSKSFSDFKHDFNKCSNLANRLKGCSLDMDKLWSRVPNNGFSVYGNNSNKIKLKQ